MEGLLSIMTDNFWKILCVFLIIYILRTRKPRKRTSGSQVAKGEYVLNIVINTDYKMSKGKIISQIGHAMSSVMTYLFENTELFDMWRKNGEPKVVLKASSGEIGEIIRLAKRNGVNYHQICDAGRTQVPPGANTVLAVGPALRSALEQITGNLKLY